MIFNVDQNTKMATTAVFKIEPYGKINKSFFIVIDTTNMIEPKLNMNGYWIVPYKGCIFYMDRKSKMAARLSF